MRDDLERRIAEFLADQEKKRAAEDERRIIERHGRAALEQKKRRTADLKADQYERRMVRRYGREAWEAEKKRSNEQFEWLMNYKKSRGIE